MNDKKPNTISVLLKLGFIPVLLATIVLFKMYNSYLSNLKEDFAQIDKDIENKTAIVLSPEADPELLSKIIYENGYCETMPDAKFIADTLIRRQERKRLPSLFSLQESDYGQVSASVADTIHVLEKALSISRKKLGLTDDNDYAFPVPTPTGTDSIVVVVERELEKTSAFQLRTPKEPCQNVPVRLQLHHHIDTLENPLTLALKTTNEQGIVVFRDLSANQSYSVLPIMDGCEYGGSKGVIGGEWVVKHSGIKQWVHNLKNWIADTNDNEFTFIEKEHRIPLFTNTTLRQIKNENTITVRTPGEFKKVLNQSGLCFLLIWWILSFAIILLPRRKLDFHSGLVVACCMLLSGLSVLMMFSTRDPLNDEIMGWDMTVGVMIGVLSAVVLLIIDTYIDIVKRYNQEKFPFYAGLSKVHLRGMGWLLVALLLTGLLFVPGLGRSVGGMRVNLKLPGLPLFQPSEIAKYLIVLFSAIFFTENIDWIIHYGEKYVASLGKKAKVMTGIILGLLLLMLIYVVLGDMGPGLVLGITFVLLYSFSKSKQDLRDKENVRWKKIMKCDFMLLVYGVVSYALCLLFFRRLCDPWYVVGSLVWLVVWVILGYFSVRITEKRIHFVRVKQIHETAIIMNLVIFVFILGNNAGKGSDSGILGRLEKRTNMCTNTWGGMDKVYDEIEKYGTLSQNIYSDPVSNTQVVHGLWALASGGIKGQGFGNGKPSVIPAFHTDMILSSIGEQWGWQGLLFVIAIYFVLLSLVAWKGIHTGEELPIFICVGIAVVTAVQLFIIALGSTGVIPLTGVTVPLLSYGKVSMILNIVAFGLALSLITRVEPEVKADYERIREWVRYDNAEAYSRPYVVYTIFFALGCLASLGVWAKYQWGIFQRNRTLIQPAFVINNQGDAVLEYNPRISLITSEMYAGRIFDYKGLLLATSNKEDLVGENKASLEKCGIDGTSIDSLKRCHLKRYYPFGNQLFFMVGDLNTRLLFGSTNHDNPPVGYMAEERHLSYLRGFDNVLYDKDSQKVEIRLITDKKRVDKYLQKEVDTTPSLTLYDYSAILPYLKDGSGRKLKKHNESVDKGDYDLKLTVDAALQKDIQDKLAYFIPDNYKNKKYFNIMRASVVVLDVKKGYLLASANYPLPDYKRIIEEDELAKAQGKKYAVYSDNNKDNEWKAYTDHDLGTTYQTYPGSTAKVMSAMAALRKDIGLSKKTYPIKSENAVEGNKDKYGNVIEAKEPTGIVTMHNAIVQSSNCYFIHLVNDKKLYDELDTVYSTVGVRIGFKTPYFYSNRMDDEWRESYINTIKNYSKIALKSYEIFKENDYAGSMKKGEWYWPWGQGYSIKVNDNNNKKKTISYDLLATPLAMARVAATVVNDGKMPVVQYIVQDEKRHRGAKSIPLLSKNSADELKGYMKDESNKHKNYIKHWNDEGYYLGGKTGTAERISSGRKINDGWYISFIEKDDKCLAIAVRIERIGPAGTFAAQTAVPLTEEVLNILNDDKYNYLR